MVTKIEAYPGEFFGIAKTNPIALPSTGMSILWENIWGLVKSRNEAKRRIQANFRGTDLRFIWLKSILNSTLNPSSTNE